MMGILDFCEANAKVESLEAFKEWKENTALEYKDLLHEDFTNSHKGPGALKAGSQKKKDSFWKNIFISLGVALCAIICIIIGGLIFIRKGKQNEVQV